MLSDIQMKIFLDRYALKDDEGNPIETSPVEMWHRVSRAVASVEKDREKWAQTFYRILEGFKFVPGGRINAGAGTGQNVTLFNCYVIPIEEDSRRGIMKAITQTVELTSRGGGVGINWSVLRPRGARVRGVNGTSSGVISWLKAWDSTIDSVIQGGCVVEGTLVLTKRGLIPVERVKVGDEVWTEAGWKKVTYTFDNGVKPVYRVSTEHGYEIEVTKDHKFSLYNPTKDLYTDVPLERLSIGSHVCLLSPDRRLLSKITSIEYVGERHVYDLEVEDIHRLCYNGFYTSNSRRGALMGMLDVTHPDVEEFITVKQDNSVINRANLSVCISDKFMLAVERDDDWDLVFPDTTHLDYDKIWNGNLEIWKSKGYPVKVYKTVKARDLWNLIIESAWRCGEPGVYFLERARKLSNTWYCENLISTNPCSEIILGPYGVCLLGHINLSAFVSRGEIMYDELSQTIHTAIRFMDNIVDIERYALKENAEYQKRFRRIGLGTLGLADMLLKLGIRYGSEECIKLLNKLYSFIRNTAYYASSLLAKERGPFEAFDKKKYLQSEFVKRLPKDVQDSIKSHGIRNAWLLTQAPTGTGSLLAGTSSGIEPIFSFETERTDNTGTYTIVHPLVKQWRERNPGKSLPSYFVTAMDLTPEEHVKVQATVQKYVDNSVSKTVNMPNSSTVDDVRKVYTLGYELGCKGLTVYRDGSRVQQVLKTVKPQGRPPVLHGCTYKQSTGCGSIYITVNEGEDGRLLETFLSTSKSGGCVAAFSEALGRLVSTALRAGVEVDVLRNQLCNIRCPLPVLGGASSCPDAIARVFKLISNPLDKQTDFKHEHSLRSECPDCGYKLVFKEGCVLCTNCGYSECT